MGNWITVNIEGSCPKEEVGTLRDYVNAYKDGDYHNFHCLSNTGSLCGVNDWVSEGISVTGNLAERDFTFEDVAETLRKIGEFCPNADIKVHVGGDYESLDCVKTVYLKDGEVLVLDPERPTLAPINQNQVAGNLFKALRGL